MVCLCGVAHVKLAKAPKVGYLVTCFIQFAYDSKLNVEGKSSDCFYSFSLDVDDIQLCRCFFLVCFLSFC